MGLLTSILTAPITGPIKGVVWVAEQVRETVEETYYDVDAIRAELAELSRAAEDGEIDEATFDECEEELLDRLEEAEAWHAGRRGESEEMSDDGTE